MLKIKVSNADEMVDIRSCVLKLTQDNINFLIKLLIQYLKIKILNYKRLYSNGI